MIRELIEHIELEKMAAEELELEELAQAELDKQAGFKLRIPNLGKAIGSLGKATKGGKIPPLSDLGARQEKLNKGMDMAAKMRGQGVKSPVIDSAVAKVKQPKTIGQHVQDFLPFTTD